MGTSRLLLQEILARSGVSQTEIAARIGVSSETVSRWARGTTAMSADHLIAIAAVAGMRLTTELSPIEDGLVDLVHANLDVAPTRRMMMLLGDGWPACRDGLRAAAAIGEPGVLTGPIAAALCGAPVHPQTQVDVLVADRDRDEVARRLRHSDARPAEPQRNRLGETRDVWTVGRGTISVGGRESALAESDVPELRERAFVTYLNADIQPGALVHIPAIEDLLRVMLTSPWAEDLACLAPLSAVLASGRYRTRTNAPGELVLA